MKKLETELNDRSLRYDGVSIIEPAQVQDMLLRGAQPSQLRVTGTTPDLEAFNANVAENERLRDALVVDPMNFAYDWQLPPEFLSLNVEEHVSAVFGERLSALEYDSAQTELAINRVALELEQFRTRGLYDLLRVIVYVLSSFRKSGTVWGVGRGSSCASYILFLLGLHVVDPIKFDVEMEEFFHD